MSRRGPLHLRRLPRALPALLVGTIVSLDSARMTIQLPQGIAWGAVPWQLQNPKVGDTVRMYATLQPSMNIPGGWVYNRAHIPM